MKVFFTCFFISIALSFTSTLLLLTYVVNPQRDDNQLQPDAYDHMVAKWCTPDDTFHIKYQTVDASTETFDIPDAPHLCAQFKETK